MPPIENFFAVGKGVGKSCLRRLWNMGQFYQDPMLGSTAQPASNLLNWRDGLRSYHSEKQIAQRHFSRA